MPNDFVGLSLEEALNNFIFKSTVRIALLNQEIKSLRRLTTERTEAYNDLCGAVLKHADDTRQIVQHIEALSIAQEEKTSLLEYLKVATLESAFYHMGHALIEMKGLQAVSNINTCFVRRTKKYWVDLNNIETLCGLIIPHLPVYIFGDDGSGKISSYISSVYFDTNSFHLYDRRIKRDQGAKSLRIRSYGESSIISYVELKTHEDGWTGEKSTKKRFLVHTKLIPKLAKGIDIWEEIKTINTSLNDESLILYQEVLSLIRDLSLKPVVKTVYRRTAFQFPEDSSIRISLDTDLAMWSGDVGKYFPYAILEIKLEEGNEEDWVLALMNSSLIMPVDKFSKYLHGCSVHYSSVPSIPYWYNQISMSFKQDFQITHEPTQNIKLEKINSEISNLLHSIINRSNQSSYTSDEGRNYSSESSSGSNSTTALLTNCYLNSSRQPNEVAQNSSTSASHNEYLREEAERPPGVSYEASETNQCSETSQMGCECSGLNCGMRSQNTQQPQTQNMQQIHTKNTNVNRQTMNTEETPERDFFQPSALRRPGEPAVPSVPSSKPVTVPVRVEPKVFFANERTFLSWLHFAIFIGGIGAALMGLGDTHAALSGVCFIIVSVIFSIYALYLYMWRGNKIKEKDPGPYDDNHGPIILVAVFLSAMVTSVFFKFPLK
ncbi:uncharacterized protein NESG_01745 [Nematocida ausubeli]|uniref:SPX domain-containing protein n=1 Tax=Nematocida ausubeli (strain ATCC PRA-371 / ERTm2) TaxID=1913371 RepID=A0A086J0U3_NEMA1|nr:uncharacterized protein NESG_01745 [Nematocida ausubeli]KFG25761.1 hypothetical protein NESG_01745 [Nematocida ausubeli]